MTQSRSSDSPKALSDPMPRNYSCFCHRMFTTYPGIYLHLKSKHSELFQKYKQLKITKLFKKIAQPLGQPIYQLEQLPGGQSAGFKSSILSLKQAKQAKRRQPVVIRNGGNEQEQPLRLTRNSNRNPSFSQYQASRKKTLQNLVTRQYPTNYFENRIESERLMQSTLRGVGQGMPFFPFPPIIDNYAFPMLQLTSTTKKLIQKYLQEIQLADKLQAKKYLYDLMVFIDKNYEIVRDPRVSSPIFLSYCSEFGPQFIAPLLLSYLSELRQKRVEPSVPMRQLEQEQCIRGFIGWAKATGMLKCQGLQSSLDQNKKTTEQLEERVKVLIECSDSNENPYCQIEGVHE